MRRSVFWIAFIALAFCAILASRYYGEGHVLCFMQPYFWIDNDCYVAEVILSLEISATVLAALALGFWTARRPG